MLKLVDWSDNGQNDMFHEEVAKQICLENEQSTNCIRKSGYINSVIVVVKCLVNELYSKC